ncbi:MAG TPA: DNA-formamidopyrimidine glycosylase family protein [Dongiaceae bacterium]|nr:DNA-formamidopyrimidine glycosylase family protein [Dongiaceae bacterium]
MPELPDVENYRFYLDRHAKRQTIRGVEVIDARVLRRLSGPAFRRRVVGARMGESRRHGKHLLVALDKGGWVTFHFGMTGALAAYGGQDERPAYARLSFDFGNGRSLAYTDPRKLGHMGFVEDADRFIAEEKLGPDALAKSLTLKRFRELIAGGRGHVKSLLMDQSRIAGIGNLYADEILFQARLHPELPVSRLTPDEVARLYRDMRRVLKIAVARGAGSEDFLDRLPASYLLRHRGKDERCPRCGGPIQALRMGGRTAYLCPRCQSLR